MRDSQRSKLYAAEQQHSLHTYHGELTLDDVKQVVAKALLKLSKKPCPHISHPIHSVNQLYFHDGGGRRNAAAGWSTGRPTLFMPRWSRSELVTLHELGHILTGGGTRGGEKHGWRYAAVYLHLVKITLGGKAWYELYRCFRKGRVQFRDPALRKKRTLTPARRAQLVATLARARETRKLAAMMPIDEARQVAAAG